jgi:uncharacterized protein (TIGR03000 family)
MMTKTIVRLSWCVAVFLALGAGCLLADDAEVSRNGPTVKTTQTEKGRASKIRVLLPTAETKLWFDETLTKAQGTDRTFNSPALEDGKRYTYRVMAVWVEKGREVNHETRIDFRAGQDVFIDFRR